MNSRDVVLGRIRDALADRPAEPLPPTPEVWPSTGATTPALIERFASELAIVQGELIRCDSIEAARRELKGLVDPILAQRPPASESDQKGMELAGLVGAVDRPLAQDVAKGLDPRTVATAADAWTAPAMSHLAVGLVEAEFLLADTGSCFVVNATPQERLLCYLTPACVVVARADRLREHLPAAWKEIGPRAAEKERRGEFVLLTGPSRTADIEKILILGVHGPKRLIVLSVD